MSGCCVYALESVVGDGIYIGQTVNIVHRFDEHNNGKVRSTCNRGPWRLVSGSKVCVPPGFHLRSRSAPLSRFGRLKVPSGSREAGAPLQAQAVRHAQAPSRSRGGAEPVELPDNQ